jgi:hypothetical protein
MPGKAQKFMVVFHEPDQVSEKYSLLESLATLGIPLSRLQKQRSVSNWFGQAILFHAITIYTKII